MFPVASFIHFVVHGPFSRRFCSRRVRCLPCECNPRYSSRRCFRRCPCHGNHCHCSCLLGEDVAAVLPKRRRRRRRQQRTLSLVRSSFVFSRLLILTLFLRCFSASLFASAPASTLLLASCLYWLARKQSFISFVQVELRASPSSPRSLLLSASDDGGSTDGGCNDGSVFFSTSPWPVAIPSSPPPPRLLAATAALFFRFVFSSSRDQRRGLLGNRETTIQRQRSALFGKGVEKSDLLYVRTQMGILPCAFCPPHSSHITSAALPQLDEDCCCCCIDDELAQALRHSDDDD